MFSSFGCRRRGGGVRVRGRCLWPAVGGFL